jgi:hypothetical protein
MLLCMCGVELVSSMLVDSYWFGVMCKRGNGKCAYTVRMGMFLCIRGSGDSFSFMYTTGNVHSLLGWECFCVYVTLEIVSFSTGSMHSLLGWECYCVYVTVELVFSVYTTGSVHRLLGRVGFFV